MKDTCIHNSQKLPIKATQPTIDVHVCLVMSVLYVSYPVMEASYLSLKIYFIISGRSPPLEAVLADIGMGSGTKRLETSSCQAVDTVNHLRLSPVRTPFSLHLRIYIVVVYDWAYRSVQSSIATEKSTALYLTASDCRQHRNRSVLRPSCIVGMFSTAGWHLFSNAFEN